MTRIFSPYWKDKARLQSLNSNLKEKIEHEVLRINKLSDSDKTRKETLSAVRRTKAVNAVKLLWQRSIKNGTDKMTLEEINTEIRTARKNRKK